MYVILMNAYFINCIMEKNGLINSILKKDRNIKMKIRINKKNTHYFS